MSKEPAYYGYKHYRIDVFGWFMTILGLYCLWYSASGDKPFLHKLPLMAITFLIFAEYVYRVCWGLVYKIVFYDTIIYGMYEIRMGLKTVYVCASSEEELTLYMDFEYPDQKFTVVDKHELKSFIKKEDHIA